MSNSQNNGSRLEKGIIPNLKYDIPAGIVVFLVAVPLCLGIALASKAPLFSGLIAGVIGGLIIPLISRSKLSVSGPAAGLVAIVIMGQDKLGGFEPFLVATFIAGLMQLILGLVRAGGIAYFFPSSVIKGMLAGIGLIIILKMIPHAIGYDKEAFGADKFQVTDVGNTFTVLMEGFRNIEVGALVIGLLAIVMLVVWNKIPALKKLYWLPAGLVVVITGALVNELFRVGMPALNLSEEHLVNLRNITQPTDVFKQFRFPDWSVLSNVQTYIVALTVCVVASLESLLCVEAVDKLDPFKRKTPMSRELLAQGTGNSVAGLIGGLPITSVIVRSSTAVMAGGRTWMTAFSHGIFLLLAVVLAYNLLNLIPMASLAAILILVGYNLAHPAKFKAMYDISWSQFVPFTVTALVILFTDLLTGIVIGMVIGIFIVLRNNYLLPYHSKELKDHTLKLELSEHVTFMNKASIRKALETAHEKAKVVVDASRTKQMDHDVVELLEEFKQTAKNKQIDYELKGLDKTRFN